MSDLKAELSATKSTPVVLDTGKLERELEMRCQELLKVNAELETVKSVSVGAVCGHMYVT